MKAAGTYRITRQGQITLPTAIRHALDLREGQVLDFFYSDDTIVIIKKKVPVDVFRELAQTARQNFSQRGLSAEDVREAVNAVRKQRHASDSA